jgi:hypothetical protein
MGPVVIVPWPFELFSEIALRLRLYSPFQYTLSLSSANGNYDYFPSKGELCRGGYEVECFRWFSPFRLPDDADTRFINENLRIREGL